MVPEKRCAEKSVVGTTGRTRGRSSSDNRIISMHQPLYLENRLRALATRIVTGPFTIGALSLLLIGQHFAFDGDFGVRRNRQTGMLSDDNLKRFSSDASGIVVFRGPPRNLLSRSHDQQWVVAKTDRHRKGSPLIEILLTHDPAMFSRRNI